jgi:hypothetical protein
MGNCDGKKNKTRSKNILLQKEMTHGVIIRFHYQKGDPRFAWRIAYFKAMVLPRLLNQTEQNFEIAVRCNPWHENIIKGLSNKITTFRIRGEEEGFRIIKDKKYFVDFAPWYKVVGMKQYDIQSGLDSDDLVARNYIETIQKIVRENPKDKSLHISFQPEIFNTEKLKTYPIGQTYTRERGSAFFSIYQPNKQIYKFAYEKSHLVIGKDMQKSIIMPAGFCWASVHGHNYSTTIQK